MTFGRKYKIKLTWCLSNSSRRIYKVSFFALKWKHQFSFLQFFDFLGRIVFSFLDFVLITFSLGFVVTEIEAALTLIVVVVVVVVLVFEVSDFVLTQRWPGIARSLVLGSWKETKISESLSLSDILKLYSYLKELLLYWLKFC